MNKIKFCIVGCGRIAERHAEHIFNFGTLVAVCDNVKEKADVFAEKFSTKAFYNLSDMLKDNPDADVISICSPNGLHSEHSIAALNAGFTDNGSGITTSLNSNNGLLYFLISDGISYTFLSTSTIKSILGFSSNITSSTLITMPYQLNLLGKKKIFINSNHLRNSAFTSKSLSSVQTIATIPVDQPPYSMINYTSVSELEKNILFNRSLDVLDIQIVDEENKYINFQNIDWSITLCLTIEKNDPEKLNYGLSNLPLSIENKNILENNKILTQDEKELKLLES